MFSSFIPFIDLPFVGPDSVYKWENYSSFSIQNILKIAPITHLHNSSLTQNVLCFSLYLVFVTIYLPQQDHRNYVAASNLFLTTFSFNIAQFKTSKIVYSFSLFPVIPLNTLNSSRTLFVFFISLKSFIRFVKFCS